MALENFRSDDARTSLMQMVYTPEATTETLKIAKATGKRIKVVAYKISSDVDTVVTLTTGTTTESTITSEKCEVALAIGANGGHESDFPVYCNANNDLYITFSAVPTNGGIKLVYLYEAV